MSNEIHKSCDDKISRKEFLAKVIQNASIAGVLLAAPALTALPAKAQTPRLSPGQQPPVAPD